MYLNYATNRSLDNLWFRPRKPSLAMYKAVLYAADEALMAKTSWNQLLFDSATYLLAMNLPTLKSVAMNLYNDNMHVCIDMQALASCTHLINAAHSAAGTVH